MRSVQYMPAKPISHGIKVYALCCAHSGYTLNFETCTGKTECPENTPTETLRRLLGKPPKKKPSKKKASAKNTSAKNTSASAAHPKKKSETSDRRRSLRGDGDGLQCDNVPGRKMVTDNWYTSPALELMLATVYHMAMIGTVRMSEKKTRNGGDLPYGKCKGAAAGSVPRGFCRRAVARMGSLFSSLGDSAKEFYIQMVTWKDKKFVGFLSTCAIGQVVSTAERWSKVVRGCPFFLFLVVVVCFDGLLCAVYRGTRTTHCVPSNFSHCVTLQTRTYITLPCHIVSKLYQEHMGPVDRMDRDVADWGISTKSGHWPHRVAHWLWDCNNSNDYRIATCKDVKDRPEAFKKCFPGKLQNCRMIFNMDKALERIRMGILQDCPDFTNDPKAERPLWMRQAEWVPCGCKKCVFCKAGYTRGIDHTPVQTGKRRKVPTKDCTHHQAVPKGSVKRTCGLCYSRRQKENLKLTRKQLKGSRNNASWKCQGCDVFMCQKCASTHNGA